MRYRIKAAVKGNIFIEASISFESGSYKFEFQSSDQGKLETISVSKEVPRGKLESFRGSITPATGDEPTSIAVGTDLEMHEELVEQLQMVESAMSYSTRFSLQKVDWETPDQEYVAETEEDNQILGVSAFTYGRDYPPTLTRVEEKTLRPLIELAPEYDELRVAKAFWREGMSHFHAFQFVPAFYQFYFVIEDFFANGKSGKNSVMSEFRKSSQFKEICGSSLAEINKEPRHAVSLRNYFDKFGCEETPEGLAELLFEMRGALHHYSSRSTRAKGNPFNQKDFETIALLTMHLVTLAIAYREIAISKTLEDAPAEDVAPKQ